MTLFSLDTSVTASPTALLTPPFALISSAAISAPETESIPYRPARPVMGYMAPMTIFSAAVAASAIPIASTRTTANDHFQPLGILRISSSISLVGSTLFLPDPDHLFRHPGLLGQIGLAQHDDPLGLRRPGPVQGFHQRRHGRHVLDIPAQLPLLLRGKPLLAGEVLRQEPPDFPVAEVRIRREG